jgi:hypothetical protein
MNDGIILRSPGVAGTGEQATLVLSAPTVRFPSR